MTTAMTTATRAAMLTLTLTAAACAAAGPPATTPATAPAAVAATRPTTAASGLPVVDVAVGSKTYHVEVAADNATREHGLMDRDSVPADGGMIFCFVVDQPLNFWMHNTRVDLDIVYVGPDEKVVSVKSMKKFDETSVPSDGQAQYAIELAAGQAKACGVKAGDTVTVPDGAKRAKE